MKPFPRILGVGLLCGGLFVAGFFAGGFAKGFENGLFLPIYASDETVMKLIEDFGVTIPSSASQLAYLKDGFIDPEIWIAMRVHPDQRDDLRRNWFKEKEGEETLLNDSQVSEYIPAAIRLTRARNPPIELSRFDIRQWSQVSGSVKQNPTTLDRYAFLYDPQSDRVLLSYIAGP